MSRTTRSHLHGDGDAAAATLAIDHSTVLDVLRTGQRQARESGQPVVASYSQPVPKGNLLAAYGGAQKTSQETSFYWERPDEDYTLVGIGEAATCMAPAPAEMVERWRTLLRQALVYSPSATAVLDPKASRLSGPLCFGGFAFDPSQVGTPLWQDFPSGLLILPEVLIGVAGNHTILTINVLIEPGIAVSETADELDEFATIARKLTHAESLFSHLARRLWQPEAEPAPRVPNAAPPQLSTRDLQSRSSWSRMVAAATEGIQRGEQRKVVLARSIEARAESPFAVAEALAGLRRRYASAHIFALTRGESTFLGASPEQLARVSGGQVETMALAGSAPRGTSPEQDTWLGAELLRQDKTRSEHALVAEMIREALAPLTTVLNSPEKPQILKLENVQHLLTPITGELFPHISMLRVIAALHPTPAVAGEPRAAAMATIRRYEPLDRGWYAGPIGWIGSDGTGEFAVALRSALISGSSATLFAGCGIVAGSDPDAEYLESCWKLEVMLQGLGGGSPASGED
ncbi:MAG: isochorismate synthase MenF [Ktedonobacterales bacterium]